MEFKTRILLEDGQEINGTLSFDGNFTLVMGPPSPEPAPQPPEPSPGPIPTPEPPSPGPGPSPSPGNTPLEQLAASMPVGSWAKLNAANQDAVLGVGAISGTMIYYCNKMPWNNKTNKIEIVAQDHNWGHMRYVQYDMATNAFVVASPDVGWGQNTQHGYDHSNVNPFTGDLYCRPTETGSPTLNVNKKLLNAGPNDWTKIVGAPTEYEQIAIGTCWWSGQFQGAGAQGCLLIFNGGQSFGKADDGQIVALDPLTGQWFMNKKGMAPFFMTSGYTYHNVMAYSPKHNCAVYGGCSDQPKKIWRLNSDQSMTQLADLPGAIELGVYHGVLDVDPKSGNFLLLSAGELWELNPLGAGTWTKQTGTRVPPVGVGIPGPSIHNAVIASAIPLCNVVAYITQNSSNGGTMYLYKHV